MKGKSHSLIKHVVAEKDAKGGKLRYLFRQAL